MIRALTLAMVSAAAVAGCCPSCRNQLASSAPLAHLGEVPAGDVLFIYAPEEPVDTVHLTGDFLEWDPSGNQMWDRDGDGVYETVQRLEPGEYQYKFVIDGGDRWVPDPRNQNRIDDTMGGDNSLLFVVPE